MLILKFLRKINVELASLSVKVATDAVSDLPDHFGALVVVYQAASFAGLWFLLVNQLVTLMTQDIGGALSDFGPLLAFKP